MSRHLFSRWPAVCALALCLALASCSHEPPEQALRTAIAEIERGIESRDAAAIAERLADDFIGPDGMDGEGATRMARLMFLRYRDVGVTLGPANLSITGDHATARFEAVVTGGQGGALPDAVRVYDVESGWRLQDGEWALTSIRWEARL